MVVASPDGTIILNARYYKNQASQITLSTPMIGESCFDLTNNGSTVQSNAAAVIELTPLPKFKCNRKPTYSLSSNCCYDDALLALGRILLAGSNTSKRRCNDELAAYEDLRKKYKYYSSRRSPSELSITLKRGLNSTLLTLQACLKKQISDGVSIPCYKFRDTTALKLLQQLQKQLLGRIKYGCTSQNRIFLLAGDARTEK